MIENPLNIALGVEALLNRQHNPNVKQGENEVSESDLNDLLCAGYKQSAFARHNYEFSEGQKVRTRGDIGGMNFTIIEIHNQSFCTVEGYGQFRHMNMAFLEPRTT